MKVLLASMIGLGSIVSTSFGNILLQDNFDSYSTGTLTNGSAWGDWTASADGPKAIIDGSVAGRSGNLYSYSETAAGHATSNYSSTTLASAYSGTDNWVLSLDFYIAAMPTGKSSATYQMFSLLNGISSVVAVSAIRTGSNQNLNLYLSYTPGDSQYFTPTTGTSILELGEWYTLTVTGNNSTQALTISVTGGKAGNLIDETRIGTYASNVSQFDTIIIGDGAINAWADGRNNIVYLDNLSLQTIPEPSVALLGLLGLGLLLGRNRRIS